MKGRTDKPACVFPANTITIDFWGNAYYRDEPYKMATHNHVFSLSGEVVRNRLTGLFLATQLSRLSRNFSYENMGTWQKIRESKILLPALPDGTPDFAFMEAFMRGKEAQVARYFAAYKMIV